MDSGELSKFQCKRKSYRFRALLNIVGICIVGYSREQCGTVQRPVVLAAGDLNEGGKETFWDVQAG